MQVMIPGLTLLHTDMYNYFYWKESKILMCTMICEIYTLLPLNCLKPAFAVISSNHAQLCAVYHSSQTSLNIYAWKTQDSAHFATSAELKLLLCEFKHTESYSLTLLDVFCNLFLPVNRFSTLSKFHHLPYVFFIYLVVQLTQQ